MKVFGYVRLSRANREESTSVVRQRAIVAQTAAARGWTLVDTIEDVDVSASKKRLDRPGLNELRRRVAAGEAAGVLVWRLDRLARSVVDIGILLDEGIQVVSATEPFDTTSAMGRAMVEVSQVFAGLESKTIAARVTASKAHLRKVGRWSGGPVPYGYKAAPHPDGVGRALMPAADEAAVVRRMADLALAGATPSAVARALNADGVPTRRREKEGPGGQPVAIAWSASVVRNVLTSGVVLGRVREGGDRAAGRAPEPLRDDRGVPLVFWEPLLPVEDVERIRAAWADLRPAFPADVAAKRWTSQAPSRVLVGLLRCPTCGIALTPRQYRDGRQPPTYVCGASSRGRYCERGVTVRADLVEAEVEARFMAEMGHHQFIERRAVELRAPAGLAALDEAIRDTTTAMARPGIGRDERRTLFDRLESLQEDRDRLAAVPVEPVMENVPGPTFAAAWDDADTTGRRALLLAAGARLTLTPPDTTRRRWSPDRIRVTFTESDGPLHDALD